MYYLKNKKERLQYQKLNKEKCKEYRKKCYQKNGKQWHKKWYKKNKNQINKRLNNRYYNDIEYRIKRVLSNRLRNALKNKYIKKFFRHKELIGCSPTFLKNYLEKQFKKGMTWDNYSSWHIDHIIPCSKFNLTQKDEQKKCFHFSNLQPLWAKDNIIKSNNLIK